MKPKSYAVVPSDYSDEYLKPGDMLEIVQDFGGHSCFVRPPDRYPDDCDLLISVKNSAWLGGKDWEIVHDVVLASNSDRVKIMPVVFDGTTDYIGDSHLVGSVPDEEPKKPDIMGITRKMLGRYRS